MCCKDADMGWHARAQAMHGSRCAPAQPSWHGRPPPPAQRDAGPASARSAADILAACTRAGHAPDGTLRMARTCRIGLSTSAEQGMYRSARAATATVRLSSTGRLPAHQLQTEWRAAYCGARKQPGCTQCSTRCATEGQASSAWSTSETTAMPTCNGKQAAQAGALEVRNKLEQHAAAAGRGSGQQ